MFFPTAASIPPSVLKGMVELPLTHGIENLSGVSLVPRISTTVRLVFSVTSTNDLPNREQNQTADTIASESSRAMMTDRMVSIYTMFSVP